MTSTTTGTHTYTATDIEKVVRRFRADLKMIAQNTQGITESKASDYADDIEALAKRGFLKKVDVTLMSGSKEVKAAVYTVNDSGGDLTAAAPGGVVWPRVDNAFVRITLWNTDSYTAAEEQNMKQRLKITWTTSTADTTHSQLTQVGGRDFMSNGWAMQRKDFTK